MLTPIRTTISPSILYQLQPTPTLVATTTLGWEPFQGTNKFTVTVTVVSASGLVQMDLLSKSDPYAVVKLDEETRKTATVKNDHNPKFDETFTFGKLTVPDLPIWRLAPPGL